MAMASAGQVVVSASATLSAATTESATAHLALIACPRVEALPLLIESAARYAILDP
jgi:hypothetical protein